MRACVRVCVCVCVCVFVCLCVCAYFEPFSLSSPDVNENKGVAEIAPSRKRNLEESHEVKH